ncbi:MAG TPA: DinB family protein [Gemmatimonadaceae bacterium]|nr:DinB family protein [Gemmatimonadaceae bacterium]
MPPFRLQRPDPSEYHPRFHDEIASVPDVDDFASLLRDQARVTVDFMNREFGEQHAAVRYAPDKWTAREVIGHLSDCERVFGYRAMRIARGDMTVLPGFDENAYVPAAEFERRTLASVLDEFLGVRAATIGLVGGLTDEFAARIGNLGSGPMSVRAILYLTAGHELHHLRLFRERYLPAIGASFIAR